MFTNKEKKKKFNTTCDNIYCDIYIAPLID